MNYLTPPRYVAVFLIATILVMTAVLGVLMTLLLINQKRHQAFQARLLAIKHEHANNLLRTQIEIQELTFKNIAQEIHDNINLSLTLAKLTIHEFAAGGPVTDLAENAQQLISGAINDLSAISRGLNADIIHQQGLFNAIQTEIARIERSSPLRIHFSIDGEPDFLSAEQELLLFRSVQESFNNVLKHARATEVKVSLNYYSDRLRMQIVDNGIGFDLASLEAKRGRSTGIHTLTSRLRLFDGNFSVQSEPGTGTTLTIDIPIKDPNEKEKGLSDRPGGRSRAAS